MKEKACLDCGEVLIGRVDKKFCNDMCRNNYNNKLNKDINNLVRNINNILRRNRRILAELTPNGKATKVAKEKLVLKGFNFSFYTSIYTTKTGSTYYFCYEYGYLHLEDDYLTLVKNERVKE
jgi:hypothetical protein